MQIHSLTAPTGHIVHTGTFLECISALLGRCPMATTLATVIRSGWRIA